MQEPPELVLLTEHFADSPVTASQIRSWTRNDPELAPAVQYLQQGWPNSSNNPAIAPFISRQSELSLYEGCVLWGTRVVVPKAGREAVLTELHEGHPGMARMKGLARMFVWWPGLYQDIEQTVRGCSECQWSWPSRLWA